LQLVLTAAIGMDVPNTRVWYLGHASPSKQRPKDFTTALHLDIFSDAEFSGLSRWVVTQVITTAAEQFSLHTKGDINEKLRDTHSGDVNYAFVWDGSPRTESRSQGH
jgi:hypothetical protein